MTDLAAKLKEYNIPTVNFIQFPLEEEVKITPDLSINHLKKLNIFYLVMDTECVELKTDSDWRAVANFIKFLKGE